MNVASDETRDTLAEAIGNVLVFLFGDVSRTGWIVLAVLVVFVLWRVSLLFGPKKLCWRCGGKGHIGGWFGGRRECPRCKTKGLIPRVGSRK